MYVYAFLVHTRPLFEEEDDGQEDFIEEGGLVMDYDSDGGGEECGSRVVLSTTETTETKLRYRSTEGDDDYW